MSRSRKSPPIIEFKVRPEGGKRGRYYLVQIFERRKDMRDYCRRTCPRFMGWEATGVCHSFTTVRVMGDGRQRVAPLIGLIHLAGRRRKDGTMDISPSIVYHEAAHAAHFYARLKTKTVDLVLKGNGDARGFATGVEEAICGYVANIIREITNALYNCGAWK